MGVFLDGHAVTVDKFLDVAWKLLFSRNRSPIDRHRNNGNSTLGQREIAEPTLWFSVIGRYHPCFQAAAAGFWLTAVAPLASPIYCKRNHVPEELDLMEFKTSAKASQMTMIVLSSNRFIKE